jgi:hypothetical protein
MDGTAGSTTFTDSSPSAHTPSAVGDAEIDTIIRKFGTGSVILDGSGDYVSIPDSADFFFGTGDFTIECQAYTTSDSTNQVVMAQYPSDGDRSWSMRLTSGSTGFCNLYFAFFGTGGATELIGSDDVPINQFVHVAVTRSGSTLRIFANGSVVDTETIVSDTLRNSSGIVQIGMREASSEPFSGQIDEVRILKGAAAWTSGFTPPTSAY